MKKIFPFISLIFLASCGEKGSRESTNSNSTNLNFTVEIDTVQVDPGDDHFIYLSNYMNTATLSSDKKLLYNFNPRVPELEIIDLDALELREVIALEKEGPTGISGSSYFPMVDLNDNGDLYLTTWNEMYKLNADRDEATKFRLSPDFLKGQKLEELERIELNGFISDDGDYYFGAYGQVTINTPKRGLAIVNLLSMELQKIPLDIYEKIQAFDIVFRPDENSSVSISESVFYTPFMNKILISSTTYNEVYMLDLAEGSVEKKSFHSNLTDDAKKGDYEKTASSEPEMMEINEDKMKEVTFYKLHYDDQNEKFWRFSTSIEGMIGDSTAYQTVLTIFDKNLSQIHEEKVDFLAMSALTFFKDGSLYSFTNLEDELGFVRIKPTYEKN